MQTKTIVENASIANSVSQEDLAHLRAQLEYAHLVENRDEAALLDAALKSAVRSHVRNLASKNVIIVHRVGPVRAAGADGGLPLRGVAQPA